MYLVKDGEKDPRFKDWGRRFKFGELAPVVRDSYEFKWIANSKSKVRKLSCSKSYKKLAYRLRRLQLSGGMNGQKDHAQLSCRMAGSRMSKQCSVVQAITITAVIIMSVLFVVAPSLSCNVGRAQARATHGLCFQKIYLLKSVSKGI